MQAGLSVHRTRARWLLVAFYLFAGINHFWHPDFYLPLIPPYLPAPDLINWASGIIEILLALGVAYAPTRRLAVWGILAMLLAFVPSHWYFIQIGGCVSDGLCVPLWVAWLRLLLIHPFLLLWAWWVR